MIILLLINLISVMLIIMASIMLYRSKNFTSLQNVIWVLIMAMGLMTIVIGFMLK